MHFVISGDKLREVFPAFLIVNRSGRILDFGPAIARHVPSVRTGDLVENHFSGSTGMPLSNWEELARERGRALELHASENGLVLTGAIIPDAGRYLLALNPATASLSLGSMAGSNPESALHISDFTPGDPTVDVLLLVRMQQAMLDDAGALATSLAKERERNAGLIERVSRLAGFLAHDFNNILSIIRLNAERLAMLGTTNTQGKRLASIIDETAERGSGITRSFMTLSRGNTESSAAQSADELISQHWAFFAAIAGPDIIVSANLGCPDVQIHVATGEFINCLTNLVINSRDAIVSSGALEIATCLAPSANPEHAPRLQMTITDTGVGMAPEIVQRVFEPFFSTKKQGNGIGLSAVADYVRECGGSVHLESTPGFGTKATLTFPVVSMKQIKSVAEVSDRTDSAPIGLPSLSEKARTVLLVEDEPYALEALVEMLEAEGFEVWPANSAEEATEKLYAEDAQSRSPAILLTDVILPRKSGIELAKAAVAKAPLMKVILMSGFVPSDGSIESDWLFAPKPLNSEKLLQLLKSV